MKLCKDKTHDQLVLFIPCNTVVYRSLNIFVLFFKSLLQIIKTQVQDPVSFLLQHIHKDLEQLMNTLGKSSDETTNVVHLILSSLLKESPQHRGQEGKKGSWK